MYFLKPIIFYFWALPVRETAATPFLVFALGILQTSWVCKENIAVLKCLKLEKTEPDIEFNLAGIFFRTIELERVENISRG